MLVGPWLGVVFSFWYVGVVLWGWFILHEIRAGDASSSGVELLRSRNPVRFWLRVGYEILIWLAMAAMPVGVLLARG